MSSPDIRFPELFDVVGVLAGALDGALFGATRGRLTVVGVATFGFVTTFGGAVIRDMLLGEGPAAVLSDPLLTAWVVAILLAGVLVRLRWRLSTLLRVVDCLYLPVWVVLGTDKAIHAGLDVLSTLLLGVITGVGGGLLRDMLAGEVPALLRRDTAYAFTALAAAVLFLLLHRHQGTPREADALITVLVVFVARMTWIRVVLRRRRVSAPVAGGGGATV